MNNIYNEICQAKHKSQKLLAILLDPEKIVLENFLELIRKIKASPATHVFVGGSTYDGGDMDKIILLLKQNLTIPILIFPGHPSQISRFADGLLFLMLLSGRNPDYLIGYQVEAIPYISNTTIEVISTGYLLIESGIETTVQKVSKTKPIHRNDNQLAMQTALAGVLIGNKIIYLEAGSGAQYPVPTDMIRTVAQYCNVPLIVGGGIRCRRDIDNAYEAGATLVVIGTAFENDPNFFTT
ncbi:geranylgeranylglyceryl/heptaprenylglyceryl phosphate synthase [Flavobacterium aciduliphilum]|uniref:Geranylgeranylglyceryl phosphate synthase n=1 Tax=Flavobacterium aciduliphilum TaxID=1101402 RepID=A0A328YK95_9FLAO|nr:geranylgeranylglyceryl/heptaprenylglyceryl phosphate synthase [Flavobacterium aciduliphilum]RAR72482.1 putative glycerol-1-phosphate prenyltransferase [Flavobacterium aciduliphilum]